MKKPLILIVDDSALQRRLHGTLVSKKLNYEYVEAENGAEALDIIASDTAHDIFAVLLDLSMPGMDGRDVLREIQKRRPHLPVIVITSTQNVDDVVAVIKLGAFDYLIKPANAEMVQSALQKAERIHALQKEVALLRGKKTHLAGFNTWVGKDPASAACIKLARQAAASDITVFITGESGVGKEVMARAIHDESPRHAAPFIAVNCGAIPKDLVESTLFGHVRGSFTGAIADALGKFREADGGTLFLDEIGELPMAAQVKLLRVLQQQEVEPVGAGRAVPVTVRVIAATNRDPVQAVQQGTLREDLYYRLNVFPIFIPPLRERPADIPVLTDFFIQRYATRIQKNIAGIDGATQDWMQTHTWRGNVRELENRIYRAVLLSEKPILTLDLFTEDKTKKPSAALPLDENNTLSVSLVETDGTLKTMERVKAEVEQAAMIYCKDNVVMAAKMLGVGKSTLYRHRQ